jgi:hypothetical protein
MSGLSRIPRMRGRKAGIRPAGAAVVPPRRVCRAKPYKKTQEFPDRQTFAPVVSMISLLANGRQVFCPCPGRLWVFGCHAHGETGALWRTAGWLVGRWRKYLPPGWE